jgi:glutamine synthetase
MTTTSDVMKLIKDKEVQFIDLRFNDLRGKMQHVTFDVDMFEESYFQEGTMFDGSSIAGWKAINESDMVMRPDVAGAHIDPFFQQTTLALFCDILEPGTLQSYDRCPRGIAKKAEAYVKSSGAGDTAYFGPEAEFFVFDDVRWSTDPWNTGYSFDSTELPVNSGKAYDEGNMGHRPGPKGGYFPVPPVDSLQDMRSEMLSVMKEIGLATEKHHHEVAPAQHELGLKFNTLVHMADSLNLYKYVIHNVAQSYGKSATFIS